MKKLILTLLNFFIVLTFTSSPIYSHAGHALIGGPCTPDADHVMTAIGCVHTQPDWLAGGVLDIAVKMGGGIAFIFLLVGAFHLITSGGEPESIQHAKQQMTAAISGLLLIVFSVVILRIIGIDVLGIPGFQRGPDSIILP